MKLSTEQIQQIEEKLYVDYDFYYDDVKHEVIDHIASEIEEKMKTDSFEASFDRVFENWHNRLREVEWSGMHLYGKIKMPLFYKEQLMATFKNDLIILIFISLLAPVLIYLFKDSMEIETINSIVFIYKIIVFAIAILLNQYVLKKYKEGNYTTVYGQIAAFANKKTLAAMCLMAISMIFMQQGIKYIDNIELWLGVLVFFNAFYFMFIIKYCNYFRHLKMIKNIKKWKNV
ncbi:hypothetical protein MG290_10550 [Flavobacterium sp. CBA20B-1]|uniref:hypothetical protein n=1 Tax=unclassified Flavobacterium TaxID=196869 RepID=UPI002225A516|nr:MULTISPECIES: hypothetical protein [unclassified Flavobacterium]WCM41396.1 hypothetical protein MG290_10550 [Flavobacterium sp. CBA20B-1]